MQLTRDYTYVFVNIHDLTRLKTNTIKRLFKYLYILSSGSLLSAHTLNLRIWYNLFYEWFLLYSPEGIFKILYFRWPNFQIHFKYTSIYKVTCLPGAYMKEKYLMGNSAAYIKKSICNNTTVIKFLVYDVSDWDSYHIVPCIYRCINECTNKFNLRVDSEKRYVTFNILTAYVSNL